MLHNSLNLNFGQIFGQESCWVKLVADFLDDNGLVLHMLLDPEFIHRNVADLSKSSSEGHRLSTCGISVDKYINVHT